MRSRRELGQRNIVGKNISQLRIDKCLGQGELVSRIQLFGGDMNQAKLSRIEGQFIVVGDRDLYAIARALDVPTDALYSNISENQIRNKK